MPGIIVTQQYDLDTLFMPNPAVSLIAEQFGASPRRPARVSGDVKPFDELVFQYARKGHSRRATVQGDGHIRFKESFSELDPDTMSECFVRTWKTLEAIAISQAADVKGMIQDVTIRGDRSLVKTAYRHIHEEAQVISGRVQGAVPASELWILDRTHGCDANHYEKGMFYAVISTSFSGEISTEISERSRKRA